MIMGDIIVDNVVEGNDNTKLEVFLISQNIARIRPAPIQIKKDSATSIESIRSNINPQLLQRSYQNSSIGHFKYTYQ